MGLIKRIGFVFLLLSTGCAQLENQQKRQFSVERLWVKNTNQKYNYAYRKINRFTPILFENLIIQSSSVDGIVAINRESREIAWSTPIQNGVEAAAVLENGRLYFGANNGQFYCLDAKSGKLIWATPTRVENLSEPSVANGVVYFLSGDNHLFALDAQNGRQIWVYVHQDPSMISIRGGSKPLVYKDTVYVGFSDGTFSALNAKSGNVKWDTQFSRGKRFKDIDSDPVIDGEHLFVGAYDDAFYCLNLQTGQVIWKKNGGSFGSMTLDGDQLFYASTSGELLSIDRRTGKDLLAYKLSGGIASKPVATKSLLVLGESTGRLVFLDKLSGRYVSGYEPGRGVFSAPLVVENEQKVYFVSNENNLYAVKYGWNRTKDFSWLQ